MADSIDSLAAQAGVSRAAMLEAIRQEEQDAAPSRAQLNPRFDASAPSQRIPELEPGAFPPSATSAGIRPSPNMNPTWAAGGMRGLPLLGGIVGGATGGVPGALLGGAGGEAFKQHALRFIPGLSDYTGLQAPDTPGRAAAAMGIAAGEQGLQEGLGRGLGKGLKGFAHGRMESALRIPGKAETGWRTMRGRAERKPFFEEVPADMTDAALEEGIKIDRRKFTGTKQVEDAVARSGGEAQGIRDWMTTSRNRRGVRGLKKEPIRANGPILESVWDLKAKLGSSADAAGDAAKIDKYVEQFQKTRKTQGSRGGPPKWDELSIDEVNKIKTDAQNKVRDLYGRKDQQLSNNEALHKQFLERLAGGAQRVLENEYDRLAQILGKEAGELGAANARTGRLKRLEEVVRKSEERPKDRMGLLTHSLNLPTAYIPRLIQKAGSPEAASRMALAANSKTAGNAARQAPRVAAFSLGNLFGVAPEEWPYK